MADIWMDVDTALAEVPVNLMPLIDDTDFKTIEGAVAYNAAGMALRWHFVTTAGAYTVTSVTPTTGGDYDWTDQGDSGIYTIEIPASGGASINNDTEGFGWFTGSATGILPWRGPVIGFRRAALNDMFIDGGTASTNFEDFFDGTGYAGGTAKLDVNLVNIAGSAVSTSTAQLGVNVVNAAGTAWGSGAITAASVAAGAITAAKFAAGAIDAAAIANNAIDAATFAADVDAEAAAWIWNAATASYGTAGTYGALLESGNVGGGAIVAASVTGAVGSVTTVSDKTGYTLTATTGLGNQTANITGNLSGSVGSVTGAVGSVTGNVGGNVTGSVGSVVGAVGSVTGNVGGNVTGSVGSVAGAVGSVTAGVTVTTNNDKSGYALTATTGLGNQTANITGTVSGNSTHSASDVVTALGTGSTLTALAMAANLATLDTLLDRIAPLLVGNVTGAGTGTEVYSYGGVTATVTVDVDGNVSNVVFS